MDRPIIYDQADVRDYDHLHAWRNSLFGLGQAVLDLLGSSATVVAGFAATPTAPTSLNVTLAAGDIYLFTAVDASDFGSLPADNTQTMQQGFAAAQTMLLNTTGLGAGQSRWALIQATFTATDDIPSDDPNGGLLPYIDTTNPPGPPWSGPNNSGATQVTRRKSVATVSIIYGTVASTGLEVPPNPSAGSVPLYLIDLAFGQTTISAGQILVAGPSVGVNVPNNYPKAPFLEGLQQKISQATADTRYAQITTLRRRIGADTTFVISPTGDFATADAARQFLQNSLDFNGFQATLQFADSLTHPGAAIFQGLCVGQTSAIILSGNAATPANVRLLDYIAASKGAWIKPQNFQINGATQGGFICNGGYVDTGPGLIFGPANASAAHFYINGGGIINVNNSYSIVGGAQCHYRAYQGEITVNGGITITSTGTPAFQYFADIETFGSLGFIVTGGLATFTGAVTAQKFLVGIQSFISAPGAGVSYLPGGTAGVLQSGVGAVYAT